MRDVSQSDLELLIKRAGVSLPPEQVAEIQVGWELLQPLLARLQQEDCDFSSEPAPLFRADAFCPVP